MRELEFRSWDKLFSKYLYFVLNENGLECVSPEIEDNFVMTPLDFEQYTRLKDSNGVKIFEGDIVRYNYQPRDKNMWRCDSIAVISFESTGFFIKSINDGCLNMWLTTLPSAYVKPEPNPFFEVIGNIKENPELLESK